MEHLRQILESDPANGRLDRAALEIATIQFPGLNPGPSLDRLNDLASHVADRIRNFNSGRDFIEAAQKYLFDELGYHGNEEDYFDPLNSCLNEVLDRRTGIPITLSILYMEIGRRLQMPLYGIGLPRHFVVEYDDGIYATYIDPFHGGRPITPLDCFVLAGAEGHDLSLLARVSKKQIVMRMLHNLYRVYLRRSDLERAVSTLNWLIIGFPEAAALRVEGCCWWI